MIILVLCVMRCLSRFLRHLTVCFSGVWFVRPERICSESQPVNSASHFGNQHFIQERMHELKLFRIPVNSMTLWIFHQFEITILVFRLIHSRRRSLRHLTVYLWFRIVVQDIVGSVNFWSLHGNEHRCRSLRHLRVCLNDFFHCNLHCNCLQKTVW